jgi:chromate transport protein ChrA
MKTDGTHFLYGFALLIVVCVLAFVYLLIVREIPDQNRDMVNMALGAFITSLTTVVSYFFGSSKGSADKTELLKQQPKE